MNRPDRDIRASVPLVVACSKSLPEKSLGFVDARPAASIPVSTQVGSSAFRGFQEPTTQVVGGLSELSGVFSARRRVIRLHRGCRTACRGATLSETFSRRNQRGSSRKVGTVEPPPAVTLTIGSVEMRVSTPFKV